MRPNLSETTPFYGGQPPADPRTPRSYAARRKNGSSNFFVGNAALRATTNPGATKDQRCRYGGDLPPPGLRLPPSRDALRRASSLADGGASPPPIRAPSPRRDTNAAFAAHESTRNPHPRRVTEKHTVAGTRYVARRPRCARKCK